MSKKITAFTLIELLVVIVIIGILSTISVAAFSSYQEQARLAKLQYIQRQFQNTILAENAIQDSNTLNALYTFDESIYGDESGEGNYPSIRVNGTRSLNDEAPTGIGRFLEMQPPFTLEYRFSSNLTKFTIAGWVKIDEMPNSGSYARNQIIGFYSRVGFFVRRGHLMSFCANVFSVNASCVETSFDPDKWHYVVGSYNSDNNNLNFWLNGELVGTQTNAVLSGDSRYFRVASFQGTSNRYVDDIMLFDSAFDGDALN